MRRRGEPTTRRWAALGAGGEGTTSALSTDSGGVQGAAGEAGEGRSICRQIGKMTTGAKHRKRRKFAVRVLSETQLQELKGAITTERERRVVVVLLQTG